MRGRYLVIFFTLLFPYLLWSETIVGGVITRDTRWKAADGPFHITSDLVVPPNIRLTITPGTRVIIGGYPGLDSTVQQYDDIDRRHVSIKVSGTFICSGKNGKRISFVPASGRKDAPAWYGILLDKADEQFTEIVSTDIIGAYCGITVKSCSPAVSNCIIEYNHIGLHLIDQGSADIVNCIVIHNNAAGIRVTDANPVIMNSIIAFNSNNGIWGDGHSKITCTYNCIFGNGDGNFLSCDPELGLTVKKNKRGDSLDTFKNIFVDPVFEGSVADSLAQEQDIHLPTESSEIRDTAIASIIHEDSPPPPAEKKAPPRERYHLSRYSPCINAGNPSGAFKDQDGTRNDMGIWGGPNLVKRK